MSFLEENLGQDIVIGSYTFSAEEIIDFARKYDPQPFHLDMEAAKNSIFGGLCASGWHTSLSPFILMTAASLQMGQKDVSSTTL